MYYDKSLFNEVKQLARRMYDKALHMSDEFRVLSSIDNDLSMKEFDRLYDEDIDVIFKYKDMLDDGGTCIFHESLLPIVNLPIEIRGNIVSVDTNQIGGYDVTNKCVNVYFSLPQYIEMKNNYDFSSVLNVILHELIHVRDMNLEYYQTRSRLFISRDITKKDLKTINKVNSHIYDVLYRLWSDTELNAQPYTITHSVIKAIEDGIESLNNSDSNDSIYKVIKKIISYTHNRNNMSNSRFKSWFIKNSYKRLNTLTYRVLRVKFTFNKVYKYIK